MAVTSRGAYLAALAIGGLLGACGAHLLLFRYIPFPGALEHWSTNLAIEGAIAGGLLTNLVWILLAPRRRVRRSAMIGVAANVAAWVAFLIAAPSLTPPDFEVVQAERGRRDADSGLDMVTHEPVIVAARMHGTYGALNGADRLLGLFAGPAIEWTAMFVVPVKYGPARATRRESFVIAGAGFILSTAFWAAFAPFVSTLVRRYRRSRQRARLLRQPAQQVGDVE